MFNFINGQACLTFSRSKFLPHLPSLKSLLASSKTSVSLLLEGLNMSSLFSEKTSECDDQQQSVVLRGDLPCLILTLHCVDELSVPAPQFPPLSWVTFAVLRVRWVEGKGSFLCVTLLWLVSLSAIRTILTRISLVVVRAASLHSPLVEHRRSERSVYVVLVICPWTLLNNPPQTIPKNAHSQCDCDGERDQSDAKSR